MHSNEVPAALSAARMAVKLVPMNVAAHTVLGQAHLAAGSAAEARVQWIKTRYSRYDECSL